MSSTKEKILDCAIALFNTKGLVNVSIRDISNKLGISPGNLTYHFKNKLSIIQEIYERIVKERTQLASEVELIPSFANINSILDPLLDLYDKYRFFYLDSLEINRLYPSVAKRQQEHIQFQIQFIKTQIDYSVRKGNMKKEPHKGFYQEMAHTVWMLLSFWLNQQIIRGEKNNTFEGAKKAMWNLVIPILTEKGKNNFGIEPIVQKSNH